MAHSIGSVGYLSVRGGHLHMSSDHISFFRASALNDVKRSPLQVFAHEVPFSHSVPGRVFDWEQPLRPPGCEILGLSDGVWILVKRCWDGDPTVRPRITDVNHRPKKPGLYLRSPAPPGVSARLCPSYYLRLPCSWVFSEMNVVPTQSSDTSNHAGKHIPFVRNDLAGARHNSPHTR